MDVGQLGQLMGGTGILITSVCAALTLKLVAIHQRNRAWVDAFAEVYKEAWENSDISYVRACIVSDRIYNGQLRPVLEKRLSNNADLDAEEAKLLDNIDKFIATLIRLRIIEEGPMTQQQKQMTKTLKYAEYWGEAAEKRSELVQYTRKYWKEFYYSTEDWPKEVSRAAR